MDGQPGGPRHGMIQDFLSGGGGSRPDGQNTGSAHGTNTHARARTRAHTHTHTHTHTYIHTYIHTYACIDRHMRQTDGHTCTCIDGKLKDNLFKTCIIMYRDNVRNRHVRACRGIHARLIILKFPMKMNDLVPSSPTYFIFIGYLKTGGMEGVRANPMKPNWIRHCLYMHANAQTFWLHYA